MPIDINMLDDTFFDDPYDNDPFLSSFLYNKHLLRFGELFRKICDFIDVSQNNLSDLSKMKYGHLIGKNVLRPGASIGSLSQDAISRAQLGNFRPTPQQIYFWMSMIKQCFKELGQEIDPQTEEAFWLLSLGGPPHKVDWAVNYVKAIEEAQQRKAAEALEHVKEIEKAQWIGIVKSKSLDEGEKNTDVEIPSTHPLDCKEIKSDMRIENVSEVRAAILKITEKQEPQH